MDKDSLIFKVLIGKASTSFRKQFVCSNSCVSTSAIIFLVAVFSIVRKDAGSVFLSPRKVFFSRL